MACHLDGAKPSSEPMLDKFKWNLNRNLYIFIQENAFENVVWEMAVILSQPQGVNYIALLYWAM